MLKGLKRSSPTGLKITLKSVILFKIKSINQKYLNMSSYFKIVLTASLSFFPWQIRDGRKQTLSECLKKEFRLTINILRKMISGDVYEVLFKCARTNE